MVEMWGQGEIETRDRINAEKKWYEEGSNNCVFTRLRCDRGNLKNHHLGARKICTAAEDLTYSCSIDFPDLSSSCCLGILLDRNSASTDLPATSRADFRESKQGNCW